MIRSSNYYHSCLRVKPIYRADFLLYCIWNTYSISSYAPSKLIFLSDIPRIFFITRCLRNLRKYTTKPFHISLAFPRRQRRWQYALHKVEGRFPHDSSFYYSFESLMFWTQQPNWWFLNRVGMIYMKNLSGPLVLWRERSSSQNTYIYMKMCW